MEITEVRIKLMEESEDRLRAFCSITIDASFVVRDLKIIEGTNGPFVAMPSRKLTERCHKCGYKNHLRSNFCNQCGSKIRASASSREFDGNANKLYADIAHPINQGCRDVIQQAVVTEYRLELERAKLPGYQSRYDDEYSEAARQLSGEDADQLFEQADGDVAEAKLKDSMRLDTPTQPMSRPHFDEVEKEGQRPKTDAVDDSSEFGRGILDSDV